jgi:2-amino-4-hydroxy-6-hydroxymethyldihydropteridine diphosphokinase
VAEAVLALGTNLGDRQENLRHAIDAIGLLCGTKVARVSRLYETDPVGYDDQPDFLNCAVVAETALSPRALLGACLGVEAGMGRLRTIRNGPRVIDIDLLLYEGETAHDAELTLPHPRLLERAFVLCPLADLYPGLCACGLAFEQAYRAVSKDGVRLFAHP